MLSMPSHKVSKNVYLEKKPFGSSVDYDVANNTYHIYITGLKT
jgi:hypothetical protein